jgi:hypothetical protein
VHNFVFMKLMRQSVSFQIFLREGPRFVASSLSLQLPHVIEILLLIVVESFA